MKRLGRHALCSVFDGEPATLDDPEAVRAALRAMAAAAGCEVLSVHVHRFEPYGVTGVALLAESHASIHTWPELGAYALDLFSCGDGDPAAGIRSAMELLGGWLRGGEVVTLEG